MERRGIVEHSRLAVPEVRCAVISKSWVVIGVLAIGCDPGPSTVDVHRGTATSCTPPSPPEPTCTLVMRTGQKDAYLDGAGRRYSWFPVHTSMQMVSTCSDPELNDVRENVNHGTSFATTVGDPAKPVLEVTHTVASLPMPASVASEAKMVFAACDCDGVNAFLGGEDAAADALMRSRQALSEYIEGHMPDSPRRVTLLSYLQQETISAADAASFFVAATQANGDWTGNGSWTDAFGAVSAKLGSAYHVCNNDAALQQDWMQRLAEWSAERKGPMPACDRFELCSPIRFYFR